MRARVRGCVVADVQRSAKRNYRDREGDFFLFYPFADTRLCKKNHDDFGWKFREPYPDDARDIAGAAELAGGVGRADGDVDSSGVHGGSHV